MIKLICIGWILGVSLMGYTYQWLPLYSTPILVLSLFILIMILLINYRLKQQYLRNLNAAFAFIFALILGINYADARLNERLQFRELTEQTVEVVVSVQKINRLKEETTQQEIEVINWQIKPVLWNSTIQNGKLEPLKIGHYYRVEGKVKPVHAYATHGVFDVEQWYIQQNWMGNLQIQNISRLSEQEVNALGYGSYVRENNRLLPNIKRWIEKKRLNIREFIQKQPIQHKGLSLALLTGDESLLTPDIEEQFQRFGMSHLLAISGPHVLILAFMMSWLIHKLICKYRPQIYLKIPKQYFLIAPFLAFVVMYCAFVGFEIPALRTLLVCILTSILILSKHRIKVFTVLLISASVLLIFDPFSILSAAFWLSYGACFVLLRIYQTIQNNNQYYDHWNRFKYNLKILIESQWKIFLALFPLMIIFFKQVAWITPVSNLFAIPWIGLVIVPLDIIAGALYFIFEPFSQLVFQINDLSIGILLGLLNLIDRIFSPSLIPVVFNFWILVLFIIGLVILFMPQGIIPRVWSILCFIPIFLGQNQKYPFELVVLDVGQGQSIFLRHQEYTMLIDTGGYYDESKFSVGKQIIQPFLAVNAVKSINDLVLTHLDQDHSGAYDYLKNHVLFKNIYSNEKVESTNKSKFKFCEKGQSWTINDELKVEVLSPESHQLKYSKMNKNENSCVLYMQLKSGKDYQNYLFMGDAGWETEFKILNDYPDLKVDVLVLGHHGSQHSSSYDFLNTLKPKLAIASAGFNNRYGHPSEVVKLRLKELNIPFMVTAEQGSIHFKQQKNGSIQIEPLRYEKTWLSRFNLND